MIKIYTVTSCSSCKKAKEWMEKHRLPYVEIDLLTANIKREDFLEILALTEDGTADIISRRSHAYRRLNIDFETISLNELVQLMEENRTLLRRPLILDDRRLQVGYNDDEIRKFLPRPLRRVEVETAMERARVYDYQERFERV